MQVRSENMDALFAMGESTVSTYVDNVLVATCGDIFQGGLAVIALYWVINVTYPKHLKRTLEFLSGHVLQLNKHKLTACVQRVLNKIYE